MVFRRWYSVLICLFLLHEKIGRSQKLKENIYTNIGAIRPCFRRLNSTGVIGCTSEKGGNVGVILYLEREEDFDNMIKDEFSPYIVVIDPYIFNGNILHKFQESGMVNGVILPTIKDGKWKDHYPKNGYSDDSKCPDSNLPDNQASCSNESPWNPSGSGTMWENWGFPIFLVENSSFVENIHDCYLTHNTKEPRSWPLCSLELSSNMYAAGDSQTCLRRSGLFSISPVTVCDPLSDDNIHYFVKPRPKEAAPEDDNSVIIVAAKMDALSMFDQVETGFDSPASGIVTLLSVANMVAKNINTNINRNGIKNVLFMLIHGESFDYIGSTRLVHDMKKSEFPFNNSDESLMEKFSNGSQPVFPLSSIHSIIEIDQVSNTDSDSIYLHTSNNPSQIVNSMLSNTQGLRTSEVRDSLPPSSSVSFLSSRPSIPTVVVSNYRSQFSNPMYHSIYDTAARAGYNYTREGYNDRVVTHLAKVSDMVSSTIIDLVSGSPSLSNNQDQKKLINELLNCYTITANCSMFYEASEPDIETYPWKYTPASRGKTPFPQYVGVRSSFHTLMTKQVLQYLTGDEVDINTDDTDEDKTGDDIVSEQMQRCRKMNQGQNIFSYIYVVGDPSCYNVSSVTCGKCLKTTVQMTPALSPIMKDFDTWDLENLERINFPTWTESIWKSIGARMFLRGSQSFDQGIFALGLIVSSSSFLLIYWMNKNASVIFLEVKSVELDNPIPVEM